MKANDLRSLFSRIFESYNFYFGHNTGDFGDNSYKINYQLKSNILLERERVYMVDIDIWSKESVEIDVLADQIESMLNYNSFDNSAVFYLQTRYTADEKNIYRRTLVYEVHTFNEN